MGRAGPPDVNLQRAISHQGSTTEPLPYPVAILGAGVGFVLLVFFFIQIGVTHKYRCHFSDHLSGGGYRDYPYASRSWNLRL